ncbi:MAG: Peptidoglycan glycosyltransferase [Myxococcales bacterium]|nr:Peptidoglycan glycosyltransferase [Myxococcales bacterium]
MSDPKTRFTPSRWVKARLYFSAIVLGSLFGGLCWRAYVLQVRESDRLKAMAEDQYLKDVELPPKRGRILDRNGVELAASTEVDSVHVNARMLIAADRGADTARQLADVLHLDRRELEKKLKARRYFTWVKRRISPEEARAVRELQLPGVYLDREPRRYYPNRGLAGPLLGWAGLDAVGQEGIELQYDRFLRGTRAQVPGLRDALGRAVLIGGLGEAGDVAGNDLYTTIDRYIQFRLERALEKGVTAHRAKAGVAVALDPANGEVLAMAAVPTLNPNEPDGAREHGARNRAVTDPFEPGSTMKTFTISGAIEAGVVRVDEDWWCENGHMQVGGKTIHDAEPIGDVTTTGVLAKSSNVCAAKIAAREGRERLREILLRFGFGRPTGVDLPGERAGQIRALEKMGPVETATMAFGQGLTATPLQVTAAYAAIANGGTLYRPHVIRRVLSPEGQTVQEAQVVGRRAISADLASTMRTMLHAVSQKGGTAQKLSVPGYLFAGKTGTAQKVDPVTRRYSPTNWAASFVGFAPYDHPRLVLFVLIDEPTGAHHGSDVAGPIWQEVMIDAVRWLGVPPTEAIKPVVVEGGEKKQPKVPQVAAGLEDAEEGDLVPVVDDESDARPRPEVPDFSGMSVAEALQAARHAGLRLEVVGSGKATAQSPGPGALRRGAICKVSFTPPG